MSRERRPGLVEDSVRLFQLVIDNIPQFIFWKDRDSVYLGCNRNFAAAAGVSTPKDIEGKTDFDLAWTREQAEFFRAVDREVMDSGQPRYHIIEPQLQANGKNAWLDTSKIPLFDVQRKVVGILGTYEDITERKLAEEAVREREARLSTTLNAIAEGVIATDAQGRVTAMNPVAETLLGCTQAESFGKPFDSIYRTFSPQTTPRLLFAQLQKTLTTSSAAGVRLTLKDGITRELAETASPIVDPQGAFMGIVVVVRDITTQRHLEEQLLHSQKMESVGQLAGGIAHDFNNMLSGILGAAELLRMEPDLGQRAIDLVDLMSRTSHRAAELTAKLLTFSRRGRMQNTPVDLHATIADVVAILQRSVDRRIVLTTDLGATHATVSGDPSELQNALLNLCINARDAIPEEGEIKIATRNVFFSEEKCRLSTFAVTPGDYLEVAVQDTGLGIPQAIRARVFEPFFTTKPIGQGTGLGLAAVYGAVTTHGGAIELQSEAAAGTTFTLWLPLSAARAARPEKRSQIPPGHGTVLVVDDEDVIRDTCAMLLQSAGYTVLTAGDGEQAVEVFRQNRDEIALVLLDVIMPRMDGRECFLRLKQLRHDVRVIMVSGFVHESVIDDVMAQGAKGFLKKPYRRHELTAALHQAAVA
ncbi:MAG: PAS domain-containing protein [Deltaproteobacteria bacterium]|nr:PAS domain-containing protein [Deltaproteobacteria bacterium]